MIKGDYGMAKLNAQAFAIVFVLSLLVPPLTRAADDKTPNSATTATSPAPVQKHRRHKKTAGGAVTSKDSVNAAGTHASREEVSAVHTGTEGMSNSLGNNNPSEPNMGSPDHIPGSTGTSGQ
jgi:hypothetical protein